LREALKNKRAKILYSIGIFKSCISNPGQPHQNLLQNIRRALDISGLKSLITTTAGKRSAV
jgi:hypothetical protein